MALPKEPRQKMINIMYLVLTAILALNVSAEILEAFKTVDKSLQNSTTNIESSNVTLFKSLASKLNDPQSKANAEIWAPKAEEAKKLSDGLNDYIESLKKDLKVAAGLVMKDGKEDFKEDNLDASTRLFENGGKGKELEQKLKDFKTAMLAIHPEIKAAFESNFPVDAEPVVGREGTKKDFTAAYFHMTPTVAALTMLSKFQNNVKNAENQVVTFCHNKIGEVKVIYDRFAAVVGQSSNYLMPNDKMTITAGVGAFSAAAQPQITIAGSPVPINADGVAVRDFTAEGVGAKSVPVSVTYTKPDGTKETKNYTIEYTVGSPSGASVSADYMNVFYIGVDNPVTISPGTGWDKATATLAGAGTMTGSGDHRVVRVTGGTEATVNVTANNKTTPFKFRVKTIPDPYGMVGPSKGGKIASNVFKAQDFIRAQLDNFDFKVTFDVVSANVYFGGAGFVTGGGVQQGTVSNGSLAGIKDKMNMCKPGSIVSFDDLKVKGPDGRVRTIQPITFILN